MARTRRKRRKLEALHEYDLERFQKRVRQAVGRRYGNLYQLGKKNLNEKEGLVHKPTISAWVRKTAPRLPFSPALLRFARETDTSLDWLLLNRGSELLSSIYPRDVESLVRVYLLRAVEHWEKHEEKARRELIEELAAKAAKEWPARAVGRTVGRALETARVRS